jgi:hypothetical protein
LPSYLLLVQASLWVRVRSADDLRCHG